MAIGSHGRGRGGTVGDGRPGRRPTVEKLFSFLRVFVRAAVKTDQLSARGERRDCRFANRLGLRFSRIIDSPAF